MLVGVKDVLVRRPLLKPSLKAQPKGTSRGPLKSLKAAVGWPVCGDGCRVGKPQKRMASLRAAGESPPLSRAACADVLMACVSAAKPSRVQRPGRLNHLLAAPAKVRAYVKRTLDPPAAAPIKRPLAEHPLTKGQN